MYIKDVKIILRRLYKNIFFYSFRYFSNSMFFILSDFNQWSHIGIYATGPKNKNNVKL